MAIEKTFTKFHSYSILTLMSSLNCEVCCVGLTLKPHELIKFLESNGFEFIRAKGDSHHI